eukprot:13932-Heterococcus_DN1.PRE.6
MCYVAAISMTYGVAKHRACITYCSSKVHVMFHCISCAARASTLSTYRCAQCRNQAYKYYRYVT